MCVDEGIYIVQSLHVCAFSNGLEKQTYAMVRMLFWDKKNQQSAYTKTSICIWHVKQINAINAWTEMKNTR